MVNLSCGLHVHVGLGAQRIPLEHLRRIASLSYAIEPLLFTLHDPLRIVNAYCRPLRHHSLLAERESQDPRAQPYHNGYDDPFQIMVHHHIGRDRRHGEHPILTGGERFDFDGRVTDTSQIRPQVDAFLVTRQPGHFEPYVGPGDSRHTQDLPGSLSEQVDLQVSAAAPSTAPLAEPPRKRKIPRLRFPHYDRKRLRQLRAILEGANPDDVEDADDADEDVSNSRNPSRVSDNPSTGTSVFDAARRVYAQPASCYISNQMSSLVDFRLAINFDGYRCQNIGSDGRHTIEFRMGEGSLDAQWISTWAKICAGVFRFAIYSSPGDFISVLANCDRASKEDGSYDIVDLLDEIGLFAEAELVEKRLAAHKDQWNLQYAGQKKP
ncbi:hypothetical protein F5Y10DRAFT_248951 [Nemania abortiva]|nr:hypothetical protein F5Y10DRAFT_248951 [Nemania abortiva]